jgi:hypothetical protein
MDRKIIEYSGVDYVSLTSDKVHMRAFVDTVMDLVGSLFSREISRLAE